jgi:ubiquinone/menaquinone biosynthesis C-methylase UbiE
MRHKNLRSVSRVRRDYDRALNNYDRIRLGTLGGQYVDKMEQEFVASIIKGSSVLEVGTATGRFTVALTSRGSEYTGVDLSRMMLQATRERTNQSVSLIQMDGCQLGFRSYFNYVLCIRTFHFLSKPVEALSGMYAALQPSANASLLSRLITF